MLEGLGGVEVQKDVLSDTNESELSAGGFGIFDYCRRVASRVTLVAGLVTMVPGCAGSGYVRAGVQTVSTTTRTSETGNSCQLSGDFKKPLDSKYLINPSLQIGLAFVNTNGFTMQPQLSAGVSVPANSWLTAKLGLSLGMDNFFVGLGEKQTKQYIPAPYQIFSSALDAAVPVGKNAKAGLTAFAGAKIFDRQVKFHYDDTAREQIQPFFGGNLYGTIGNLEVGSNIALYPTDPILRQGGVSVWGDAYVSVSWGN